MDEKVRTILAELRRRLERIYGPRLVEVVLYGSQARGDAGDGSDIDVLVVLKDDFSLGEEIKRTSEDTTELSLANDVDICCLFMDEHYYRTRQGPLLRNIRKEGIII